MPYPSINSGSHPCERFQASFPFPLDLGIEHAEVNFRSKLNTGLHGHRELNCLSRLDTIEALTRVSLGICAEISQQFYVRGLNN